MQEAIELYISSTNDSNDIIMVLFLFFDNIHVGGQGGGSPQ